MCSPFLGGANFELYAASRGVEVFGSDIWEPLIQFWHTIQKDPKRVAEIVWTHYPGNKEKYKELKAAYDTIEDEFEKAACFFALNRMAHLAITFGSYRSTKYREGFTPITIGLLEKFHAPRLHIERLDYRDALKKHEDMITYLDPPYLVESNFYGKKGELHEGFDHEELCSILKKRKGWMLSYNNCDAIKEMYADYKILHPKWVYKMNGKESNELLILNF